MRMIQRRRVRSSHKFAESCDHSLKSARFAGSVTPLESLATELLKLLIPMQAALGGVASEIEFFG
jgi:hypothetical protein